MGLNITILQNDRFLPLGPYSIISIIAEQQSLDIHALPVSVTMKVLKSIRGVDVCGWGEMRGAENCVNAEFS